MSKILAIDLGTGNSCMSVMENGKPTVITNAEGERTTPSFVAWNAAGERLVGSPAKRQAVSNPKKTVYEVKRFIGRKFDEVQKDISLVSYDVVRGENGDCRVQIDDRKYSPEEISSFILAKLKKDAEAYLGDTVSEAIITCPAYFNDSQRAATKAAGEIAGLKVLRVINEPTAAALAYGQGRENENGKHIAVADSGSGTLDFSILSIEDGVYEVLATAGDSQLGGKDYDQAIMTWLINEFKAEQGVDISKDAMAVQRVKDEAEKAKIALSSTMSYEISLPFLSMDATGPKHLMKTLTRAKFEQLVESLNDRYDAPAKQCIKDADVKIDEVILVGGTTRIPSVQEKIKSIFGVEPSKGVNPDEVVSCGAAVQSGVLSGEVHDVLLLDVTPLTLSIETMGGIATPMIDRNTTIPVKKSQVFSTASDNQPAVTIRVAQGERKMFNDNKVLGQFNLDGIAPAPRGVPQIEVTFDIDANGILKVSATDKNTGKEQNITITNSSGLSKEEIERAKSDAEAHAEEDRKRAEEVELFNRADSVIFNVEKMLKDGGDKVPADVKTALEGDVSAIKEAKEAKDVEKCKKLLGELEAKLAQAAQASQAANESFTANAASGAKEPVDAEVVDDEVIDV